MMGRRALVVLCAVAEAARVVTPDGPVVGFAKGGFDAFLGLPFAAPPVGDLRFRAPQRPANWTADRPGGGAYYGDPDEDPNCWTKQQLPLLDEAAFSKASLRLFRAGQAPCRNQSETCLFDGFLLCAS